MATEGALAIKGFGQLPAYLPAYLPQVLDARLRSLIAPVDSESLGNPFTSPFLDFAIVRLCQAKRFPNSMKMSQIESQSASSPPVYRCSLAYVFIEGKQIARDNAHLVLKTETGSSPALATRLADISLPSRHTLLVYIGNSTEPKVFILLVTPKDVPAKAAPLPMIRYSHQRQYLHIYTKSGSTSSPNYDLRFATNSSLEEAISILRQTGIRPMLDGMEMAPPKLPASTGLRRHTSTSSPGLVLSAADIRAGRVLSPFQRRLDGSTPPFALKRVHSLQRTSSAMSSQDTSQDGSMTSMAQRSQSTIMPREQRPATYLPPDSVPKRSQESSVSRGSPVTLPQTSQQISFQGSAHPFQTLPTLEEERSDELDFPIPNLDAGLGQTSLTAGPALEGRPLKRRKGNRSQRKVQPEPSSWAKMSPDLKQDSTMIGRDGQGRVQNPARKTTLEARSLPLPQLGGLNQGSDVQLEVETGMSQERMRSMYDSYVWEELREGLFSDVDRVSDDDLTMRLLVDRYERDMIEQIRNMSRS